MIGESDKRRALLCVIGRVIGAIAYSGVCIWCDPRDLAATTSSILASCAPSPGVHGERWSHRHSAGVSVAPMAK